MSVTSPRFQGITHFTTHYKAKADQSFDQSEEFQKLGWHMSAEHLAGNDPLMGLAATIFPEQSSQKSILRGILVNGADAKDFWSSQYKIDYTPVDNALQHLVKLHKKRTTGFFLKQLVYRVLTFLSFPQAQEACSRAAVEIISKQQQYMAQDINFNTNLRMYYAKHRHEDANGQPARQILV